MGSLQYMLGHSAFRMIYACPLEGLYWYAFRIGCKLQQRQRAHRRYPPSSGRASANAISLSPPDEYRHQITPHPRLRVQVKGDHGNDRIPSWHPPARSRGSSGHCRRSKRLQRRSGSHAGANGYTDHGSPGYPNEHPHAGANGYSDRHSNSHCTIDGCRSVFACLPFDTVH